MVASGGSLMTDDELLPMVSVARVQRGDVIVLKVAVTLDEYEQQDYLNAMKRLFPHNKAMILGPDVSLEITRSEASHDQ
jgi:hypothetical protein